MTLCRIAPLLLLLGSLAGCAVSPTGEELDGTVTGSIAKAPLPALAANDAALGYGPEAAPPKSVIDGVAPSDWERVRLFAATNLAQAKDGEVLDWTNADTGSNGTMTAVASSRQEPGGRQCRAFALTISDLRGIRGYSGDACRSADGMWQLFDVSADDRALL
ncbi:MAG: hypothetical protein J0H54_02750 [Rhizobiales bacterium]|nr:hypothetical protein [Hyphomicrobiales bacterium]